jgi:hypothetical protein
MVIDPNDRMKVRLLMEQRGVLTTGTNGHDALQSPALIFFFSVSRFFEAGEGGLLYARLSAFGGGFNWSPQCQTARPL